MIKEKIIKLLKSNVRLYTFIIFAYDKFNHQRLKNGFLGNFVRIITGEKKEKLANISVFKYLTEIECAHINIEEEKTEREVYLPIVYPKVMTKKTEYYTTPAIYSSIISNIIIYGETYFLSKNGYLLNDKFDISYNERFNFENGICMKYSKDRSTIVAKRRVKKIEKGIWMIGDAANNYYHWFFDLVSKIVYINKHKEWEDIPILVDETVKRHPTCLRLLEIMDKYGHEVIYLKRFHPYLVGKLYYVSPNTWANVYVRHDICKNSFANYTKSQFFINSFRDIMYSLIADNHKKTNYKKIFITRGKEFLQRLINESDLVKLAEDYGFKAYDPMQFPIEQQASDFASADFIIAVEGAALANLIWCKKNTKIICVNPEKRQDYLYSTLAKMVGANCVYLDAEIKAENRYFVDKIDFKKCLELMLNSEL